MDRLDVQILARLSWEPYRPADKARGIMGVAEIAKDLDVHVGTVRRRLHAMREAGVFGGVRLLPEHTLLGQHAALYRFRYRTPRGKERAVDMLRTSGHPAWFSFVGTEVWVVAMGLQASDLERFSAGFAASTDAREHSLIDRHHWDASTPYSELDRRIMWALRNDAHRPLAEVAKECGITERTARRRFKRLVDGGAVMLFADVAPSRMRGLIAYVVAFDQDDEDEVVAHRFFDAFPEAFWRGFPRSRQPFVYLAASDTKELDACLARAYEVPGVERPRLLLMQDNVTAVDEPGPEFLAGIGISGRSE